MRGGGTPPQGAAARQRPASPQRKRSDPKRWDVGARCREAGPRARFRAGAQVSERSLRLDATTLSSRRRTSGTCTELRNNASALGVTRGRRRRAGLHAAASEARDGGTSAPRAVVQYTDCTVKPTQRGCWGEGVLKCPGRRCRVRWVDTLALKGAPHPERPPRLRTPNVNRESNWATRASATALAARQMRTAS